jgi:RimJ/RimL family protein N-acetyltransferase
VSDFSLFRAIKGPIELDRFLGLPYTLNHELADDLREGRRRADWMWMALIDDSVVARVAWWGNPGDDKPSLLDIFDISDPADPTHRRAARDLLETATRQVIGSGAEPPGYIRYVPPDWRDNEPIRRHVETLIDIAEQAGARVFVERLRFEWRNQTPIAPPSGRLDFRRALDDDEILDLMTAVVHGSLDAHTVLDLTTMTPREAAHQHFYSELAQQISTRDNWRVATDETGATVGFVTPGHNHYHPVIGYLAVLPEHRGNGYVHDILATGTRILADQGVGHIRAATDLTNVPMAAAFERAGWINFERSLNLTWKLR